jgi:hypothetical protein
LVVRRFRCTDAGCKRRIFCERFPQWLDAYARSTSRLQTLHRGKRPVNHILAGRGSLGGFLAET